jgi:putative NADPH-quinone reductase
VSDALLVLLGSSRGEGNTARALNVAFGEGEWLDLANYPVAPYDYEHRYERNDAFFSLAEKMARASDIVLATPVYWYAMSAQMKIFLDRWSDLVTVRKDLGRALAGRRLWLLATSAQSEFPRGFEAPFELTARYMDMIYAGGVHLQCSDEDGAMSGADMMSLAKFVEPIRAGSRP